MKKSILFLALSLMFVGKSNAQVYWQLGGNAVSAPTILGTTTNYGIQFQTNGTNTGWMDPFTLYTGIGGWSASLTPNYQLDVLGDIDVAAINNGYRIGGSTGGNPYVLWHNGDISSIYVGVGAGFHNSGTLSSPYRNTVIGYNADGAFGGTGGTDNTVAGYSASTSNTSGYGNSVYGSYAHYSNTTGRRNTVVGDSALHTTQIADSDVAIGYQSLYKYNPSVGLNMINTAVGFQSGVNQTTGGDNTYVGTLAGAGASTGNTGVQNTVVGNQAFYLNTTGSFNTAVGHFTLYMNDTGYDNTAIGYRALRSNTGGYSNTATGWGAMYNNITGHENTADGLWALSNNLRGVENTAIGYYALMNDTASNNTATGGMALQLNTGGKANVADGSNALRNNLMGSKNTAMGSRAMFNNTGDSNSALGDSALFFNTTGTGNLAVGDVSGLSLANGVDNTYIGARADAAPTNTLVPLSNAAAIGYKAVTTQINDMVLGNNNINVTIGLSGKTPGNGYPTRLELSTQYGASPFNITWATNAPLNVNGGEGTGWSGLRFDDLKAGSRPGKNPGPGYLALDTAGNVIYVDTAAAKSSSGGIGTCNTTPTTFSSGDAGAINLAANNNNFFFEGNNSGALNQNDVLIGYPCSTSTIPGKLSVLQQSGAGSTSSQNSIGIYVENDDVTDGSQATPYPVIGIESKIPAPSGSSTGYYNVAGWFEADAPVEDSDSQYAIFVPHYGGIASIGFPLGVFPTFTTSHALLYVNGGIETAGSYIYSDSTVKKDMTSFNQGLKVIRGLNPISYRYNGKGGLDTRDKYVGVKAQNLARVAPYAVRKSVINKDTVLEIYEQAVLYTAINAIKQLDSMATDNNAVQSAQQHTIDNLRNGIDSLRTAFKSIQSCLDQLCANSQTQPNIGTGNSGENNATNVTLSSANAPMLYQNIPNPFSTGTKINYYLPEGTVGATIVFYDTYGNQLKVVQLSQTGNGTLNISPDNLSNGIYSYSLIVNGSVIDTKRMLLQK